MSDAEQKRVVGYCEPWSARAGESITLRATADEVCDATLSLIRIDCGDPTGAGPGYAEHVVPSALPSTAELIPQAVASGSYASIDLADLVVTEVVDLRLAVQVTRPRERQIVATVAGTDGALKLVLDGGRLMVRTSTVELALRPQPLTAGRWYDVELHADLRAGSINGWVGPIAGRSPGRDVAEGRSDPLVTPAAVTIGDPVALILGGSLGRGGFDGRIARPRLTLDRVAMHWDLSQDIGGRSVVDASGHHRHGQVHQLPSRAVTGPGWDGSQHRWIDDPGQWDAIHFHTDDLYDAEWHETTTLDLPEDLPSGIYAFRLETKYGDDRVPFFVRPAVEAPTADVALLMSTATYLAYANHRTLIDGAEFFKNRGRLRPEHDYVRRHPEVGPSLYERHADGSGVMYSSRRRPVLNLRPGADGWNFTPDTDLNAFLKHLDVGHDIVADEDVHTEGADALRPYRVIVTSTHPEYWSTPMLDALETWQREGGRLLYLGGNGFYWRIAFSDAWPGAIELRRTEDGVRNWETPPGEGYHAFTGEYGGLWRRLGRAPNELVGVGFCAQGFERAAPYRLHPDLGSSRAAWILDGVDDDEGRIGTSGLGGGAAGQEIDRYDEALGSPAHAVVVGSATVFGTDMVRTKEEFGASVVYRRPDPKVRADIVFYETEGGGAVFSVGSIAWFGSLARDGYDNDTARMTANVVRRFLDPTPFTYDPDAVDETGDGDPTIDRAEVDTGAPGDTATGEEAPTDTDASTDERGPAGDRRANGGGGAADGEHPDPVDPIDDADVADVAAGVDAAGDEETIEA
ncbi:MAG: N,N-dimethylformamidase beta subunit family domain-containing protein [Actinomycetota bacterium]